MKQLNHDHYDSKLLKCIYCNQYHKRMNLYVEDNVRLVELKSNYLMYCTSFNITYLSHKEQMVKV